MKDQRLYHSVSRKITDLIDSGAYPPGSRLPGERELAEMFDVSRVTIREAEIELQALGMIRIKTGSGVYVLERQANPDSDLPQATAFELTEARLLFESEGAALAAAQISDEQLDHLDDCVARMVASDGDEEAAEIADRDFHLGIAAASGNSVVRFIVEQLWKIRVELGPVRDVYAAVCTDDSDARGTEHSEIQDALRARDPKAARAAMRKHFRRLLESMIEVTEEQAMAALQAKANANRQRFLKPAQS